MRYVLILSWIENQKKSREKGIYMSRSRASAKKAGTQFETECARYLSSSLKRKVTRMPKTGALDKGDLYGIEIYGVPMVGECKSPGKDSSWSLSGWWKETEVEMDNVLTDYGVLIIKRFQKSVEDAFCVVNSSMWEKIQGDEYYTPQREKSVAHSKWASLVDEHTVFSTPRRGIEDKWIVCSLKTISSIIYAQRYIPTIEISPEDISHLSSGDKITVYDDRGVEVILSPCPTS